MKILFISENYYPLLSGVPVVVKYLAEGLVTRGHDVSVLTQRPKDQEACSVVNGVNVYRFDIYKDFFHVYRGDKRAYVNFALNFETDVIIFECAQCITTDLLLPYIGNLKAKKILHSHGFSGVEAPFFKIQPDIIHTLGTTYNWVRNKWYYGSIIPKALPNFDKILCLAETDNTMDYLNARGYESIVLDNAADNMFFQNIEDKKALSKYALLENDNYMMSCANYQFVKDQITIINEYYRSDSSRTTSLVCIGSQKNAYYEECLRIVVENEKKYGHRDVHLLVGVDRKDIPSIVNGSCLYLVASRCERYSISIIEAMSQGVPFISTNVGNARILPGGITLMGNDTMSEKIDYLLTNKEEYKKYSTVGREFAYKNCRIDNVISKLECIIEEVCI